MTFLPSVDVHIGRHRLHLAFHVGDAGLQRVAVQHARGDVMPFGDHEIGQLQLARARRGADDHMAEQRAEADVAIVLGGEFLDHLGAALGIGAVILGDDLDHAAVDAAAVVDQLGGGRGGAVVPAAVGGADAGAVHLEADLDRRGRSARCVSAPKAAVDRGAVPARQRLQRAAACGLDGHGWTPSVFAGVPVWNVPGFGAECAKRTGFCPRFSFGVRCRGRGQQPKPEKRVEDHEAAPAAPG